MKKIYFTMCFIFSLLSNNSKGQIFNGDFEVWDSTYMACYDAELKDTFNVPNPLGGVLNKWDGSWCGMCQTTDAYSGNYALILYNWYVHATGSINLHDSISHRPLFLQGQYKYIMGGFIHQAHGQCDVSLTRTNGSLKDTIAVGSIQFDSVDFFTPFQITLNYMSNLIPDSINIFFINAAGNSGSGGLVDNLLYLDDLTFSNSPLSIENINSTNDMVNIYPNPSFGQIKINVSENLSMPSLLKIYNLAGQLVYETVLNSSSTVIHLNLQDGFYQYVVEENGRRNLGKIVIAGF